MSDSAFRGARVAPQELPPLSEKDFLRQVVELAEIRGWQWLHLRPGMTRDSWRTPISGPLGKGWVDLVLVRNQPGGGEAEIIFAELKTEIGKLTPEQEAVQIALSNWQWERNTEVRVWRPSDWEIIMEDLA